VVERYIQLKGCKYVDEIVPYATEQDLKDLLMLMFGLLEKNMQASNLQEEIIVKKKVLNCILTRENTGFLAVS